MNARSKKYRPWSHSTLWMGAFALLLSWAWHSDAHSYVVRKKDQTYTRVLVNTSQLHTYPLSRVANRCDLRHTATRRAIERELRLQHLVKAREHCRSRRYKFSSLTFRITSATPATVSGRRECRVRAYADLFCKRTILDVTSHNTSGYYQGKRWPKGPSSTHGKRGIKNAFKRYGRSQTRGRESSCTSWGTPSTRIKAMARQRIARAANILCQRHRLPRVLGLRLTRTYSMKKVVTKNHYLCTQTFLYAYTCSK